MSTGSFFIKCLKQTFWVWIKTIKGLILLSRCYQNKCLNNIIKRLSKVSITQINAHAVLSSFYWAIVLFMPLSFMMGLSYYIESKKFHSTGRSIKLHWIWSVFLVWMKYAIIWFWCLSASVRKIVWIPQRKKSYVEVFLFYSLFRFFQLLSSLLPICPLSPTCFGTLTDFRPTSSYFTGREYIPICSYFPTFITAFWTKFELHCGLTWILAIS